MRGAGHTRPTTSQRGYDYRHQRLRAALKPHVDAGNATCWRCTQPIQPGDPWDLGHDDHDRSRYRGPEHTKCNRNTAALRDQRQRTSTPHSRDWLA